jgi:hypothetical protein
LSDTEEEKIMITVGYLPEVGFQNIAFPNYKEEINV